MSTTKQRAFETCRIQLNLKSANVHISYVNKVTPPEFLLIRSIHGDGAAVIKEMQGDAIERKVDETTGKQLQRIRPVASLVEYLKNKYGEERFKKVFPGENPVLPFTFEDAGLLDQPEEDGFNIADGWEEVVVVTDETPQVEEEKVDAKKDAKSAKLDDLVGKKAS